MKTGFYLALVVVVALLGVVALTGQGQGASSARQTWEYKVELTSYPDAERVLNSLGAQGWELVSFAFNNNQIAILKRPK